MPDILSERVQNILHRFQPVLRKQMRRGIVISVVITSIIIIYDNAGLRRAK